MCLGIPGQVIEVREHVAEVDFWGVRKHVRVDAAIGVTPGDYVVTHCGEIVRTIPPEEVADTLLNYEIVLSEAGEDPIAAVVDEMEFEEEGVLV